jgi:Ferrochelatase
VAAILKELRARGIYNHFTLAYQSRVGPVEWLKPYTDDTIRCGPAPHQERPSKHCLGTSRPRKHHQMHVRPAGTYGQDAYDIRVVTMPIKGPSHPDGDPVSRPCAQAAGRAGVPRDAGGAGVLCLGAHRDAGGDGHGVPRAGGIRVSVLRLVADSVLQQAARSRLRAADCQSC